MGNYGETGKILASVEIQSPLVFFKHKAIPDKRECRFRWK
jgi:hypothetical protein